MHFPFAPAMLLPVAKPSGKCDELDKVEIFEKSVPIYFQESYVSSITKKLAFEYPSSLLMTYPTTSNELRCDHRAIFQLLMVCLSTEQSKELPISESENVDLM